jgi:hypothetical protein
VEVFRRRAEENLDRFERALADGGSLRSIWELSADPRGAAFTTEFAALANHRKTIRAEIARYAERYRAAQVEAIRRASDLAGVSEAELPPLVGVLLMTGLAQVLALEERLGITAGHAEALAFVDRALRRLEG